MSTLKSDLVMDNIFKDTIETWKVHETSHATKIKVDIGLMEEKDLNTAHKWNVIKYRGQDDPDSARHEQISHTGLDFEQWNANIDITFVLKQYAFDFS